MNSCFDIFSLDNPILMALFPEQFLYNIFGTNGAVKICGFLFITWPKRDDVKCYSFSISKGLIVWLEFLIQFCSLICWCCHSSILCIGHKITHEMSDVSLLSIFHIWLLTIALLTSYHFPFHCLGWASDILQLHTHCLLWMYNFSNKFPGTMLADF